MDFNVTSNTHIQNTMLLKKGIFQTMFFVRIAHKKSIHKHVTVLLSTDLNSKHWQNSDLSCQFTCRRKNNSCFCATYGMWPECIRFAICNKIKPSSRFKKAIPKTSPVTWRKGYDTNTFSMKAVELWTMTTHQSHTPSSHKPSASSPVVSQKPS